MKKRYIIGLLLTFQMSGCTLEDAIDVGEKCPPAVFVDDDGYFVNHDGEYSNANGDTVSKDERYKLDSHGYWLISPENM